MKYTPDNITKLEPNQIFVFGSNESGINSASAALLAQKKFGAKHGVGFGLQGQSFAIPSKDWDINTLPIDIIRFYVGRFLSFAEAYPYLEFLVTKIGTGLAGYDVRDIAPLFFRNGEPPNNVILPEDFWRYMDEREDVDDRC
jgi:hypothetical protein